jgi:thiol-disulfide isomerase/thioredoxin
MAGLIALVAALAVATALGVAIRRRSGRMSPVRGVWGNGQSAQTGGSVGVVPPRLTAADLAVPLGERATLVQFSTEFCTYCGPARALLGEVSAAEPGVAVVEIDAAERMDLTRRLNIFATPTVFVLGPDGSVVSRASGLPKKAEVLRAVGTAVADGVVS